MCSATLAQGDGTASVEFVLNQMEYGVFARVNTKARKLDNFSYELLKVM